MSDFDALVAKVTESLAGLRTQAQEIADGGNGQSYSSLAFETTLLIEKLDERLGDVARYIAGLAGDGEDVSSFDELDTRIGRICDDHEDNMCIEATGRSPIWYGPADGHPDADDEYEGDREPRYDHWDA